MTADFAQALRERLTGRGAEDQKFLIVATLNEHLPGVAQATLVGGSLVQLFTMGAVTSLDVDLIGDRRTVKALLEGAGFVEGPLSLWRHPDFAPVVNIVGPDLGRSEKSTIVEFEGLPVRVASLEDCIVDRLCGAKHWRSDTDWERSVLLARIHADRLDMERLRARANEEGVADILDEVLAAASD